MNICQYCGKELKIDKFIELNSVDDSHHVRHPVFFCSFECLLLQLLPLINKMILDHKKNLKQIK